MAHEYFTTPADHVVPAMALFGRDCLDDVSFEKAFEAAKQGLKEPVCFIRVYNGPRFESITPHLRHTLCQINMQNAFYKAIYMDKTKIALRLMAIARDCINCRGSHSVLVCPVTTCRCCGGMGHHGLLCPKKIPEEMPYDEYEKMKKRNEEIAWRSHSGDSNVEHWTVQNDHAEFAKTRR